MKKSKAKKSKAKKPLEVYPDPEVSKRSAAKFEEALNGAFFCTTDSSDGERVIDMLTNAMHWCDEYGVNFKECLRLAGIHHKAEKSK